MRTRRRRLRDQSRKSEPVLGCSEQRPRRRDAETRPAAYRGCRSACSRPGLPTFPSLVHSHKRSPPPQPPPPTHEFPLYHPSPQRETADNDYCYARYFAIIYIILRMINFYKNIRKTTKSIIITYYDEYVIGTGVLSGVCRTSIIIF